ncbi:LamG-like jellyroll fold domain-containing protein [Aeoliella mucimassa]|uniref:LamG-like jellyroll fold domain-containing protein n=1 Tax=Aeoliella mucimassa TaxID=2527972 RepID=A0A518AHZ0_9BACT|nr:LamG-like jellyroll fold domain-containing protein [Aeoliella mucimassa]QDU54325.1 hypothetical protein Pan181_05060 [Aeoliella mucimassa]
MALEFISGPAVVSLGSLSELSGASAMSIAGWIRLNNLSGDSAIVVRGSTFSTSAAWMLWRDQVGSQSYRENMLAGIVNTNVGTLRVESADNTLNDATQWHHLAMVFEADQADGLRLFIDGVRDPYHQSTVGHDHLVVNTSAATLGLADTARQFQGGMAEFSFWNSPLADAEVAHLAAGFSPLSVAGSLSRLVLYQDFIRSVNRPGVGSVVSTSGSIAPLSHPRTLPWTSAMAAAARVVTTTTLAGPYRREQGELTLGGLLTGSIGVPGAVAGSLSLSGEVNS